MTRSCPAVAHCNSGLAYGGNELRKLEYPAADALAQGCDTLVSIGGVRSSHTGALYAARPGSMLWLRWKTFSGSWRRFTSTSRS